MRTLYGLFVAIDAYPNPANALHGCVNDMHAFHEFIAESCTAAKIAFKPLVLTDAAATRAGIVAGFEHFASAKPNDLCVWFYSGHGSRCMPAKELLSDEPSGLHDTIVAYDSRNEGGFDLANKEIAYLIAKATAGKDVHFLAVTDSCHSGSNTRGMLATARMVDPSTTPRRLEDYIGYKEYTAITLADGT